MRDALPDTFRQRADASIYEHICTCLHHLEANAIGVFAPVNSEINILHYFLEHDHYTIALPVMHRDKYLTFRHVTANTSLCLNAHAIPEPAEEMPVITPDVLIVPLLAFDRHGHRLGYGGGYYDRTIEHARSHGTLKAAIGVAYSCQEARSLPTETHDQRLDTIVTEKEIY